MPYLSYIRFLLDRRVLAALGIALLLGVLAYYYHKAKISAADADALRSEVSIVTTQKNAQASLYQASMSTIKKKMENDHARSEFKSDALASIEANRKDGDGDVAPVLRDAITRVQRRHDARDAGKRNP